MEAKYGLWWGMQFIPKDEKIDLCDMPNMYRLIIDFQANVFVTVSSIVAAKNVNRERFAGRGIVLSRENAIEKYPEIFFKSSNAYRGKMTYKTTGFHLPADIVDYIRTKKSQSAYITKLVEMERAGIIKVD